MENHNTTMPSLKDIEQLVWRNLQETYSVAMKEILKEMDQQIAEKRDKSRFRMLDKRKTIIESLFGPIEIKRAYYRDRVANNYVYLLDQYLQFDGEKGVTPLLAETAMDLAITGTSYR